LTFDGDLIHFPLPHHCGVVDFRRFISISHTVTDRFFMKLGKITVSDNVMNPQHFGRDSADIPVRIRIDPKIRIWIRDTFGWG